MSFSVFRAPLRNAAAANPILLGKNYTPSPAPEAKSSNTTLYVGLGVVAAGALTYYFYSSNAENAVKSGLQVAKVKTNFVYKRIAEVLDEAENYDDGSYGPVLLRLAWHSSGTYDKDTKTGGSNYATMRFSPESQHGANAGLNVARDLLEKVKKEFPWITYGDLWTLSGVAAVQEMGGPKIPWRPGRIDGVAAQATPDGRLPDASQGADHLRNIFYRMGFNDQEIVALSGAHALGRCHRDRSGYEGPWTFAPTTVSNDFFRLLFDENTDYVLVQDKSFKKFAKAYADSEELWFKDFSKALSTLFELGIPTEQFVSSEPWVLPTVDEQKDQRRSKILSLVY
ncbi:cytochrome c peroxidase [Gymnopilus junonius]|uniref:Peroxidase n=1 Tax=Gymnopilus junonius TaxID=109634 RepID=A0A9P5TR02_GYMJU|nr:cytochrome c peroxidase [Gymnopilus junonius]